MTTLTLKGIPTSLHEALKRRSKRNRRSLNSEAIACLEQVLVPTVDAGVLVEQIRASRERLSRGGLPPLSDAFLDGARREGRR